MTSLKDVAVHTGGLILHPGQDVAVDTMGHRRRRVAQSLLDNLRMDTVIRAVVRAFLAAALRRGDARTPLDGGRSFTICGYLLGSALGEGVEQVRPVSPRKRALPAEKPTSLRPPVAQAPSSAWR